MFSREILLWEAHPMLSVRSTFFLDASDSSPLHFTSLFNGLYKLKLCSKKEKHKFPWAKDVAHSRAHAQHVRRSWIWPQRCTTLHQKAKQSNCFYYFCVPACLSVCTPYAFRCLQKPEGCGGARVIAGYEPLDVGAGNQTSGPCKSTKCC